ncbi:hypothetical protein FRZ44_08970 [Hypericibacter terrae]|uniref:Uncharacterized protein n=1 Tax=Hypericibacter terrae TaxID=2602015 RepID=A0A5J6MH52_9PROT|nr:hypothetical protein FRZ44_08970 [Hypericibacter terrae]
MPASVVSIGSMTPATNAAATAASIALPPASIIAIPACALSARAAATAPPRPEAPERVTFCREMLAMIVIPRLAPDPSLNGHAVPSQDEGLAPDPGDCHPM